jgi:cytosine/adenosine deaminase-related metal-dependent hydrolase
MGSLPLLIRNVTRSPLLALAWFVAIASAAPQTRVLAIFGVNIVDVVDGTIMPNVTVTVSGETIVNVERAGVSPIGARVVDGRGQFLIPGLWDMHAHVEMTGATWLPLYLANGVTGIRDMGSALDLILNLRDATASGRVLGPRIFAAGPILDDPPGDWPFRMRVHTAEDGRAAVRLLKQRRVDLIKVHDHTPRDAFFAIAEEAARQHLPLAGHVPLALTPQEAIDAGQRDIEHLSNMQLWKPCSGGDDYRPQRCQSFFEMLARRGVWQGPTLVAWSELGTIGTGASRLPADRLAYAGKALREAWARNQSVFATPEAIQAFRAASQTGAAVTRDMVDAGVGILAGCDTMIAGFCVHDELAAMVRGGMTPLQALQTATINPVRYFGVDRTTGRVEPGQRADLVVLAANPLTDIAGVGGISGVVAAGRFFDRKELDDLLANAREAAKH